MHQSFDLWFLSQKSVKETEEEKEPVEKPNVVKDTNKKRKTQKYVNRRVARVCR